MANATEIKTALPLLDPKNDEHWTQDGLPAIAIVQQIVQATVTRADVTNADPQFNRAAALAAAQDAEQAAALQAAKSKEAPAPVAEAQEGPSFADLQSKVDEAQALVDAKKKAFEAAQRDLDRANNVRDQLVMVRDTNIPHDVNQRAIMDFLDGQKKVRAEKAARAKAVLDAGITPEMLRGKSPIDQAMARKRGFGLNRPTTTVGGVNTTK